MEIAIKIVLSTLLLGCLVEDLPYSYFVILRIVALFGFPTLAYISSQKVGDHSIQTLVYGVLAVLFQPIVPVHLGRGVWMVLDVIVGIALVISISRGRKDRRG